MIPSTQDHALRVLVEAGDRIDENLDIGEVALALASLDYSNAVSNTAIAFYRNFLESVVRDIERKAPTNPTLKEKIKLLQNTVALSYGFCGDRENYNDLANANLMRVIDRRKGMPVALGVLYLHVARRLDWDLVGLSFPGHFLLRLQHGAERAILDPFDYCVERSTADLRGLLKSTQGEDAELQPEHYTPVSDRTVLLRLQNNIKLRKLQHGGLEEAIATLQLMVVFAPYEAMLWRELGLYHAKLGNLRHAISALETFVRLGVPESMKHQTALLLQKLKSGLQ